jgi:hypothetical protein
MEMVKLFEYKHFKIISHYCYRMNSSFVLSNNNTFVFYQ